MKQHLQHTQGDSTLLQRDHKNSENDCYDKKKISYLGKSIGNRTKPGLSPPLCPPSFGKSAAQRLPRLQGSERGQKAAGRMKCQPRKRHKRLGPATPEQFTALQLLFGFLSSASAVQNIVDRGLQHSPCTEEPQKYGWWGWQGPVASRSPACFLTWLCTVFVRTKGFLRATMGVSYIIPCRASKTYPKLKPSKC